MSTPTALGFPGQGGDWRAAVRTLAAAPDHPLAQSLWAALGVGGTDDLDQRDTRLSQPVVFTAGLVALDRNPVAAEMAIGHSLGEITAACATDMLDPVDGLRLVLRRAALGHEQQDARAGRMVAVMNLHATEVEWIRRSIVAATEAVLDVAVINSPTQSVLSGDVEAAEELIVRVEAQGGVARALPIGGAYHSTLMTAAAERFEAEVTATERRDAAVGWVSGTSLTVVRDAADLPRILARSLVLPVRWEAALGLLVESGITAGVDAGPGDTLVRLSRFAPAIPFTPLADAGTGS